MNKKVDICAGCQQKRAIVNVKYQLCQRCNKQRLQEQHKEPSTSTKDPEDTQVSKPPKRAYINKVSDKRKDQEKEYTSIRARKKTFMIDKKYYKCQFCNSQLPTDNDEGIGWHHLIGRDGDLLTEWGNIVPAHNLCHSQFHHSSVHQLLKGAWYSHFVDRLKDGAKTNAFMLKAYNVELRRMQKAEIIDLEQYLKLYINEE